MKSYSNVEPQQRFAVEPKTDGLCDVTFWVNPEWNEAHDECTCDVYRLTDIQYRDNLAADIEAHYDVWVAAAMKLDVIAASVPTVEERLAAVESATLDLMLGGVL